MPDASIVGRNISHYSVVEKLGGGGMGVVYKAKDTRLGRSVALKFLPDDISHDASSDRTISPRSARRILAQSSEHLHHLRHWRIRRPAVYRHGTARGPDSQAPHRREAHRNIGTLGDRHSDRRWARCCARQRNRAPRHQAREHFSRRTRAGENSGFRPGEADPRGDQHAAESVGATSIARRTHVLHDEQLTSPGSSMGTVAYMSPEQARGEELDARSDLFSLGVVLYEMATGQVPFSGATSAVIFDGILHSTPPPAKEINPRLPLALENILGKALEKDPDLRCQTAAELRADLKRLKRDIESSRRPAAGEERSGFRGARALRSQAKIRRGALLRKPKWRERRRILPRRNYRRHRHRAFENRATGNLPALGDARVPRQAGHGATGGPAARRRLRPRRLHPPRRQPRANYRTACGSLHTGIPSGPSATTGNWKTCSPSRRKSPEASPRPCASLLRRRKKKPSRASPRKIRWRTIFTCADEATRAARIWITRCRCSSRPSSWIRISLWRTAGLRNFCGAHLRDSRAEPEMDRTGTGCLRPGHGSCARPAGGSGSARAHLCYAQKKYEEAALLAWRAIERKPDCEGSWNILGRAYFASGRYEEAAALAERAIEANGDDYNTYIPYGQALEKLGRKKEAEHLRERLCKVLRQQLELVPEDVRARISAGDQPRLPRTEADESIRHLQTAVALRPGDPNTLYNAACTYGVLGERRRRSRRLRRRLRPDTATAIGRPRIPISIACTTTRNFASWSASQNAMHPNEYFFPSIYLYRPTRTTKRSWVVQSS